jgi:hypothetical protein
LGRAPTKDSR